MSFYQIGLVLLSFVATAGFALNFKLWNKKHLLVASISGAAGYAAYLFFSTIFDTQGMPTLFGALVVGLLGEWFSRRIKAPALIIILPGIIPLVPGRSLYATMLHFVQEDFWMATDQAVQTLFVAGGIALGILLASLFSVSLRRMRRLNVIGRKERKQP